MRERVQYRNGERGSALLMVTLIAIPMFMALGLVVDIGWAYYTREAAHAAAEAAAIAAVKSAMDGVQAGGTYTCGSKGLACQSATACPTTIPSPTTSNVQNGCAYAIQNGFTSGGTNSQTVTIAANITSPPPTVPGVSVEYWATVQISQSNPLTFGGMLGGQYMQTGARATAGVIAAVVQDCIISLDPTGNQAVSISGGNTVVNASNCGTEVNSSSSDALDVSGGAKLTSSAVQVVGSANNHGCPSCISPTPTHIASVTDPYANLPAPSFNSSHCDYTNYSPANGATLSPGNYCNGITVGGGKSVSFNTGNYILIGGGLTVSGGSTVTSNTGGVMFYNTYSLVYNYKAINISGSTATLSAQTSGTYSGILFFQDRTAHPNGQETFSGGSTVNLNGVLYFPDTGTQVVYSGGSGSSTSNTSIDAYDITISGGSYLGSNASSSSGPSAPEAALLE